MINKLQGKLKEQPRPRTVAPETVETTELEKPENPSYELKIGLERIHSDEWDITFEGVNSIRKLISYHPTWLVNQNFSDIVRLIVGLVENLRSGLAKNAIVCLGEMMVTMPKQMEPHMEYVVPKLIKKYGETGNFLFQELDKTLLAMVEHLPHLKCLHSFLIHAKQKHAFLRNKCAYLVASCLENIQPNQYQLKEFEKHAPLIFGFLQEGSQDTRLEGKRAVFHLSRLFSRNEEEFSALVKKNVPSTEVNKVLDSIHKMKDNFIGGKLTLPPPTAAVPRTSAANVSNNNNNNNKNNPNGLPMGAPPIVLSASPSAAELPPLLSPVKPPRGKKGKEEKCPELEELPNILDCLNSSDWKTRYDGITKLLTLTEEIPGNIKSKILQIFDAFTPRISDANSKVNLYALQCATKIVTLLQDNLQPTFSSFLPAVASNLASTKAEVKQASTAVLDTLVMYVDSTLLAQPWASIVLNNQNRKIQAPLLERLIQITPGVYAKKPNLVVKHILPITFNFLSDEKRGADKKGSDWGEIRTLNNQLMLTLHHQMGSLLLDNCNHLPKDSYDKIVSLISSNV